MPEYALKCQNCAHCFEEFAHANQRYTVPCPVCGAVNCDTDWSKSNVRLERLFGTTDGTSMRFGFHPDEVQDARRELPGWDIKDTGDVHFAGRAHHDECMKTLERLQSRERQKRELEGVLDKSTETSTVPKGVRTTRTRNVARQGRTK